MDQLFKQTVHQDGQRGEADVVQRQVDAVIQSLRWTETTVCSAWLALLALTLSYRLTNDSSDDFLNHKNLKSRMLIILNK